MKQSSGFFVRLSVLLLCLTWVVPRLMAQTYTVAGSDTQALGASWSPTTTANDMTLYSGNKYYLLKTVTYSSNGSYQYKITVNHSWNTSYGNNGGGDNASYTLNSGTGFVCYTFDSSSHIPHVVSSLQTVVIAGSDTDALGSSTWNGTNTANSMTTTDGITYTMSKSVDYTSSKSNLQCKAVVAGSDWYGTSSGGNVYYNIPSAGSYTLTYTFNAVTGIVTVDVQSAVPMTPDYYITGDNGLGLGGFSYQQQNLRTMTYDENQDIYTYSYNVAALGTYYFAFADGGGSDWNDFNGNHRYGPTSGNETVNLNGGWANTQRGGGSYAVTVDAGQVTITLDVANMRYKVEGTIPVISFDYYVMGPIFPNGWNTGTETLMTDNGNDTYSWTSGQLHLDAGTNYEYKVYGSDGSYQPNGDNATFSAAVPGTYTVTVTYNSSNGNVNATLNLIQADPTYDYTFYILPDDGSTAPTLYLWGTNNNGYHPAGEWPGSELSLTEQLADGNTWYKYTGALYANLLNAIVNNGNDGGHQTSDIENLAPDTYYIRWNVNNNSYTITTEAPTLIINYYVKGDDTDIFPNGWNAGADTEMTDPDEDGIYTWTSGQFHLDAGTDYTFKVWGDNETWYPDGANATFGAAVSGTYTVTVTFDSSNGDVNATLNLIEADPTYDYTIYIRYKGDATPYAYLWDGAGNKPLGDFPGTALTDEAFTTEVINGYTYYKYTVSGYNQSMGLILNEGSGNGQTSDLTVNPGTSYFTYGGGSTVSGPNAQADPAITYYAEGSFNNWTTEGSQMTAAGDGSFSKTFSGISLIAGTTYEYKVYGDDGTDEGVWIGDSEGGNLTFTPSLTGTYDLTVTLNNDGTVSHTLTLIVAASQGTYYIVGSEELGLEWSYAPTTTMTFDSSTGIYTYTVNVEEQGSYGFVFANDNSAPDWDTFNADYRIGPTAGNQSVSLNGDWQSTQMAGSNDGGAYQIHVAPGTVTIYFDPASMRFKVEGVLPYYNYTFYILPDDPDVHPSIYVWEGNGSVLTNGYPGTTLGTDSIETLHDGNNWYRWRGVSSVNLVSAIISAGGDDTKTKDITNISPGTYYIKWKTTREDGEQYNYYELYNVEPSPATDNLYLHGTFIIGTQEYNYSSSNAAQLKYDAGTHNYYLNNVILSNNATFCFSTETSDSWDNVGIRYGNGGADGYTENAEGTNYLGFTDAMAGRNLSLGVWSDTYGEYRMLTAGVYNVIVNPEQQWVKLIKTDHSMLSPMNVYLEQTENVEISNIQAPETTYTAEMFDGGYWPLSAYNRQNGSWSSDNFYNVDYLGDTITADGKKWWHWQVHASICELFFTRTGDNLPHQSPTIERHSGLLWVTWDEENGEPVMTDHTREYFDYSANALPTNAVVMEGHYYVYFINTVGWENVYCYAWEDNSDEHYHDGYGRDVQNWPGQPCECVGIDPVTGYEVWRYDFGTIVDTQGHGINPPDNVLFNDGNPNAFDEVKEQTGDFEFINGGVFDYLGLFDGSFTLNNLIRRAAEEVRYTVSNDLLAVYYDADAVTPITIISISGKPEEKLITGALYAKDLNLYGEKSIMPDASYTDYVYNTCYSSHTPGRSQIMDKKTEYDQSNWVKLVISPNYDGGGALPVEESQRPKLENFVGHIIPAGTLDVFMTDTINPTAHVLKIEMGREMSYEPNVYVSSSFNDTIAFNYAHQEWQPGSYEGSYRTKPSVNWVMDPNTGEVLYGEVTRTLVEDEPYKMFYVAPKPQEIAYITWVVYDNLNIEVGGEKPYGDYVSGQYQPYTPVARSLPEDPGRFYAPMNWKRSTVIPGEMYEQVQYLSGDQLDNALGGFGKEYGPYSNGYMQYGAVKVNWSLFDEVAVGMPWWQIFQPGQAYKIKAIIRYARGNGEGYQPNECYAPGNGDGETASQTLNGPRRLDGNGQGDYANMYFTSDYNGLNDSKFIIFPIEASPDPSNGNGMGNVTTVKEVSTATRTVVGVRYYNLLGVESERPFEGINIVVTSYSDGSRSSRKILR